MDPSITSFAGIDIAKDKLDLFLTEGDKSITTTNNNAGHKQIVKFLPKPTTCLVVMEATGRYHKQLAATLIDAGHFVAIVNPRKVRSFADAIGTNAKTDAIDAKVIALYGQHARPRTASKVPENQEQLAELVERRRQLLQLRTAETNRSKQHTIKQVDKSIQKTLVFLNRQIDEIEKQIMTLVESDDDWSSKVKLLETTPGVGTKTAVSLIAELPELGTMDRQEISTLAGLAPLNRDSGKYRGKRSIRGGRAKARNALYMAALTARQWNPVISAFAKRLEAKGKPFKVVMTACMHKLLMILNSMMKYNCPWEPKNA